VETAGNNPPALARVFVSVVLFGVEDSDLVVRLDHQVAGSTRAFSFPTRPVTTGLDVDEAARDLASGLVNNRTAKLTLIGAHLETRPHRPSSVLISYAAVCQGRSPVPQGQGDLLFGRVNYIRKRWPEFLKPHEEVLEQALSWLFREVQDYPLIAEMLAPTFTIADLRTIYEQVWDVRLDPANFHKQVTKPKLDFIKKVQEGVGVGPGKPAAVFGRGSAELLNPPIRPPHGKQDLPSLRVWGRDPHGGLDHGPSPS
jgi:8-oxo-dGTP diphosphatase